MPHPLQFAYWHTAARIAGWLRPLVPATGVPSGPVALAPQNSPTGISVVIPSRNGKPLLAAQLPAIVKELEPFAAEVIVVDNGSDDGTARWLAAGFPQVHVDATATPLSFARAVNRGIACARYSHVCLLNNDMLLDAGFFPALVRAFEAVPELFCATAQIRFPAGIRREETGKAVMAQTNPEDFPIRCDEPIAGEDHTYVLYGSGGCSLYDAARLRSLGGADESYAPAYVEDLDLGYRAWQRGWPTVYVAGAVAEHRHRATTSRYYTPQQLDAFLEINYLKFLTRAVASRKVFARLWMQALGRLRVRRDHTLRAAARLALAARPAIRADFDEEWILALTNGDVAVFPGLADSQKPLVAFASRLEKPSPELLAAHSEIVLVRDGRVLAFRAAQWLTERKWRR